VLLVNHESIEADLPIENLSKNQLL
ncbi:MAG: hypothetical protein ACI97H_001320, partial [Marinobacter psychrophilus]